MCDLGLTAQMTKNEQDKPVHAESGQNLFC